jgi:hypothetical protein
MKIDDSVSSIIERTRSIPTSLPVEGGPPRLGNELPSLAVGLFPPFVCISSSIKDYL